MRWMKSRKARETHAKHLRLELRKLGISAKHLRDIANSGIVEVSHSFSVEEQDWEARITPWEYVLTNATDDIRVDQSLLVVRHLDCGNQSAASRPHTMAIVETAPGPFRKDYDFSAENTLIRTTLSSLSPTTITDPTPAKLRNGIRKQSPDLIHITGIDTRLGRRLIDNESESRQDGLFLAKGSSGYQEVNGIELSKYLTAGEKKPAFVGFNTWDSGSRLAPLAISEGVGTALAFQTTFDDAVAEVFYVNFYRACEESNWDYLEAFLIAWKAVAGYRHRIRGSAITLWSATSLVKASKYKGFENLQSKAGVSRKKRSDSIASERVADPNKDQAKNFVSVGVSLKENLNYSLLHNGDAFFKEFVIRFDSPNAKYSEPQVGNELSGPVEFINQIDDIHVEIELHVGTESFPYRTSVSVGKTEEYYDLSKTDLEFKPKIVGNPVGGIRMALTSDLIRSVNERIQTSVYIDVRWHDQVIYRQTHSVWLSPVDQWRLNDEDVRWIPSFVQPRDPQVSKILNNAQKYLRCLMDDGAAGFSGYQTYDDDASGLKKWEGIDLQVQAIWAALAFEYRLNYINPPPSYAESTQRLRTPTQIVEQENGTCIDLAILLNSCLEWIEIYPVMFMLNDHAFPGYWRNEETYEQFVDMDPSVLRHKITSGRGRDDFPTSKWIIGRGSYSEIKSYVDDGDLVPMESVSLTSGEGFERAVEEGMSYFSNKRNRSFHSMVDIFSSRESVTPLPLTSFSFNDN